MPGPNPEPPPLTDAEVAERLGIGEPIPEETYRPDADAELVRAHLAHATLIRDAAEETYRAAHERALAAARGGEEVLSVRTELDDSYLDTLEVAITPPNGPLVTRVLRFAEGGPDDDPTPPDVLGRIDAVERVRRFVDLWQGMRDRRGTPVCALGVAPGAPPHELTIEDLVTLTGGSQ
jgi:hypothetical protein